MRIPDHKGGGGEVVVRIAYGDNLALPEAGRLALYDKQKLAGVTDLLCLLAHAVFVETVEVLGTQREVGMQREGALQLALLVLGEGVDDLVEVGEVLDAVGDTLAHLEAQSAHDGGRGAAEGVVLVVVGQAQGIELAGEVGTDGLHEVRIGAHVLPQPDAANLRHLRHDDVAEPEPLPQEVRHGGAYVSVGVKAEQHVPLLARAYGVHPPVGEEDGQVAIPFAELDVCLFVGHGKRYLCSACKDNKNLRKNQKIMHNGAASP